MKKLSIVGLTLSVLMAFNTASAAVGRETSVRERMEKNASTIKNVEAAKAGEIIKGISRAGISDKDLKSSVMTGAKATVIKVQSGEKAEEVSLLDVAAQLKANSEARLEAERTGAADKATLDQLLALEESSVAFLATGKNVSENAIGNAAKFLAGYNKQRALAGKIASMEKDAQANHSEIMNLTVEILKREPNLTGDQAYAKALTSKYGSEEAAVKEAEKVEGCE